MKRIVIIIPTLTIGGGEKIAADNANDLALKGYDVYVLVPRGKIEQSLSNNVSLISGNSNNLISDFLFCRKQLNIIKPDIVYSYMERANFINSILSKNKTRKSILSIHTVPSVAYKKRNISNRFFINLTMFLAKKFNLSVICVSEGVKNELINDYGIRNVFVIENYLSSKPTTEIKVKNKKIIFGFVGRLTLVKGCDVLVDAIVSAAANDHLALDNKEFWIIGDGPQKEYLEKKIYKHKLNDKVFFLGKSDNVKDFLSEIDYLIVPSYVEGFGLVVLEGLYHGCSIIFSQCKYGPREIMSNFTNHSISLDFPDPSINREISVNSLSQIISICSNKKITDNLNHQQMYIYSRYNKDISINKLINVIESNFP